MPKLKDLKVTHGKTVATKPMTLSQLWGDTSDQLYGTSDESTYVRSLTELNKSDLQAHASRVGVLPMDDREYLTKKLIRAFRDHISLYKAPKDNPKEIQKVSDKVKSILAEGR